MSEFADDMANTTPVPQVRAEFSAVRLELKHLAVLITFAARKRTKQHSVLRPPVPQTLSSLFAAELRDRL